MQSPVVFVELITSARQKTTQKTCWLSFLDGDNSQVENSTLRRDIPQTTLYEYLGNVKMMKRCREKELHRSDTLVSYVGVQL